MPSSVRVKVVGARDLPEMDRTVRGEFCTDAYVDIKFRNYEQVNSTHGLSHTAPYIFESAVCPKLMFARGMSGARIRSAGSSSSLMHPYSSVTYPPIT